MQENNLQILDNEQILIHGDQSESDKEKQRLIDILDRIKKQLTQKEKKTISDVYVAYSAEQFMENKEIKNKNISKKKKFCYKFSLFIITSIYLVGSFIIVSLKKSFWNFLFNSLKCKFDVYCEKGEFMKQSNFFEYFLERLLREPIDLNLIMLWNFLGINLSNSLGFRPTSLIFLFINFIILLITYSINYQGYEPETCKYSNLLLTLIFFNWVFMVISFGGSSLLAQQKLIDYYSLFDPDPKEKDNRDSYDSFELSMNEENIIPLDNYEKIGNDLNNENKNDEVQRNTKVKVQKQKEKNKQRNFRSLFSFSLANLAGYTGKYGIAIVFTRYQQNHMITKNQTIHNKTENNLFLMNFFNQNNTDIPYNNDTNITSENYELNQNIFIYINLIYIGCILLSVLFYSFLVCCFFQNKKKEKEKSECCACNCCLWNTICEICGCVIYSERVILEKEEKSPRCCKLCCETMSHYCCDAIFNMCNCRGNNEENLCCNCCDCCNFREKHFDKGRQCFCYCYQEKGFCFWINKFFINNIQKEIILCVLFCFIARLTSIGCEVIYENIFEDPKINILDEMPVYLISLATFFSLFSAILIALNTIKSTAKIFAYMDNETLDDIFQNQQINNMCDYLKSTVFMFIKKFNVNFLGIFLLLSFNIFFGFNYSSGVIYRGFEDVIFGIDDSFNERNTLYSIIFTKVYLVFLINYYCLIIAKNRINFEFLFSQTILVTIYLIICDSIIYGIKLLLQTSYNAFFLQLIASGILGLILLIFFYRFIYFYCVSIFPCCHYLQGYCICQACCCNKNSSCYSHCCELNCSNCNCYYICCEPCCSRLYNLTFKNNN